VQLYSYVLLVNFLSSETVVVLAAIWMKNLQKRPKLGLWLRISKIRLDIISICVSFSAKSTKNGFKSEEKSGKGNSFVRHFDEKPSKTAENRRKSVCILEILGPSDFVGPTMPLVAGPTPITPSVLVVRYILHMM